jgi:UDP-N-acetylglucosamine 2-epimerase (non-hydrolysing)
MLKIVTVVGARPNFIKISPIMEQLQRYDDFSPILIHTGQHYDETMSKLFFEELGIRKPDFNLQVGSGSHATQIAEIMRRFEAVLLQEKPHLVLVVGDVNSTIACALTAAHLHIPVAHVEAGLRSFDRTMPEEINRLLTDQIAEYLFTTEASATENLLREGIPPEKIFFVGNVMIDSLLRFRDKAARSTILQQLCLRENGTPKPYALLTLHRPSNVDDEMTLQTIFEAIKTLARDIPIIFPVHPRTVSRLREQGLQMILQIGEVKQSARDILCINPLGYLDFLCLMSHARLVLTDSGGVQEETTALCVPCLTLRENTERPVTIQQGTNKLVGRDKDTIVKAGCEALVKPHLPTTLPDLWDGKAAERIVLIIRDRLAKP